jgi:hypothetical protein
VLPAAAIAAVLVAIVSVVSYLVSPDGSGAGTLSTALGGLQNSKSVTLLAQERQQIVTMNAAATTMSVAAKPAVVSPSQIEAQQPQTSSSDTSSGTSSDTTGGTTSDTSGGGVNDAPAASAASPSEAQSIAKSMMSSFGFSPDSQWECLDEVWTKESSWEYDAENPSGAYGIPQSLPASKMASDGPDYMTNATTQIKWGLGYISSTYGTPCDAWAHEVNDGWY